MNYPYQANPSHIDCRTDAHWAGDNASTTAATLHGARWLERWPVTQEVRALSSNESEFCSQRSGTARGLKHVCHESGETKNPLMLHSDSVASRGMAQGLGAGKC